MISTAVGKVQKLKLSTIQINGTSNHTASFMLDDQPVSLQTQHISIDEGDRVIVSGKMKHGLLQGLVYQNISKKVVIPFPNVLTWIVTVVFSLPALLLFTAGQYLPLAFLFLLFPLPPLSMALKISSCNSAIRSHPEFQNI